MCRRGHIRDVQSTGSPVLGSAGGDCHVVDVVVDRNIDIATIATEAKVGSQIEESGEYAGRHSYHSS